jgi:hypothetical protein
MHVEEREFVFRLELTRSFAEDYDGDDDGYAWVGATRPVIEEMLAQLVATARRAGWQIRPANRGRSTEDEVTLVVTT